MLPLRHLGPRRELWGFLVEHARSYAAPWIERLTMGEEIDVTCPWCGEQLSLWIDRETTGSFVQDCDVCCRPWQVSVSWEPEEDGDRCNAWVERS